MNGLYFFAIASISSIIFLPLMVDACAARGAMEAPCVDASSSERPTSFRALELRRRLFLFALVPPGGTDTSNSLPGHTAARLALGRDVGRPVGRARGGVRDGHVAGAAFRPRARVRHGARQPAIPASCVPTLSPRTPSPSTTIPTRRFPPPDRRRAPAHRVSPHLTSSRRPRQGDVPGRPRVRGVPEYLRYWERPEYARFIHAPTPSSSWTSSSARSFDAPWPTARRRTRLLQAVLPLAKVPNGTVGSRASHGRRRG